MVRLMDAYPGLEIERRPRLLVARLTAPHRVLSSCPVNGGLRDDLAAVVNHQCCEPRGHFPSALEAAVSDPPGYLRDFCRRRGLPENCALLSTAVNVNNAGLARLTHRGLEVITLCTAGVESNAAAAGDPATVFESDGRFVPLVPADTPPAGTINLIVCIGRPLTPAAMVTAVMTATEAKAAVVMSLGIGSRYSDALATGTGTDQIAVAARHGGEPPLTGAGKHTKLGELIGRTVSDALREALCFQNRLTASGRCSTLILLERFGLDSKRLQERVASALPADAAALMSRNFEAFEGDPLTVAAVSTLVHLHEAFRSGMLPPACRADVFAAAGARLAAAVSGRPDLTEEFQEHLMAAEIDGSNDALTNFVCRCLSVGYYRKWTS